jgi:predicted deacetylase
VCVAAADSGNFRSGDQFTPEPEGTLNNDLRPGSEVGTMSASYLVRFDDICPTMNWSVWDSIERILIDRGIVPILAVVPDNQDNHLRVDHSRLDFWDRIRYLQRGGWSIGLHGFRHCYETRAAGIIGRNRYSEFAGLPEREQRIKLSSALAIFEREAVEPDAWIAPGHSFDEITVATLADLGLKCISDGYTLFPHVDDRGMLWVPQQLGTFRRMPYGVWTVCFHHNSWNAANLSSFERRLGSFSGSFTSLQAIKDRYRARRQSIDDKLFRRVYATAAALKRTYLAS